MYHMKEDGVVREAAATYGTPPRALVERFSSPQAHALPVPLMIGTLKDGLKMEELEALRNLLDLPLDQLAPKLGISRATLHRRKAAGKLDTAESDRVLRFARLFGRAMEVFETEESARQWLKSPQMGLGGETPLDFAETEIGAREVEHLLGRIDYGVYS